MSKRILILIPLLALVALLASNANAATGTAAVNMSMGTASFNVGSITGAFSVSANPFIEDPDPAYYANVYDTSTTRWPSQSLSVYNLTCWQFSVSANGNPVPSLSGLWKCDTFASGSATPTGTTVEMQTITGTLASTGLESCYAWMDTNCTSPAPVTGNMMPNLDAFIGQAVVINVLTNWCSFIAPTDNMTAGLDPVTGVPVEPLGCVFAPGSISLAAKNSASRTLADTSTMTAKVPIQVQAGPSDCHVPAVKGLKLRKARRVLRAAHCGSTVKYVKGRRAGRVRYQTLKVGTGKPRGYKVRLFVVR